MIDNCAQYLDFSLHSTTLLLGKSPVKNNEEHEQFNLKIEKILEYLAPATNLTSLTLLEVGNCIQAVKEYFEE